MGSDKKYMSEVELLSQWKYWRGRENAAREKRRSYGHFLHERGVTIPHDPEPCNHDWITHFSLRGPTHRMCLNCGAEDRSIAEPPTSTIDAFKQGALVLNEEQSKALVEAWRKDNPGIAEFWNDSYADWPEAKANARAKAAAFPLNAVVDEEGFREPPKPVKSTGDKFFGRHTIYGVNDGDYNTPYMTRYWIGRLRLHVFHRGDNDADPHDHPWNFWTFPLTSYVEEVTFAHRPGSGQAGNFTVTRRVVRAFRLHYRPATHTHRVLGRYDRDYDGTVFEASGPNPGFVSGKIITICWRGNGGRKWGFLRKDDAGKRCWIPWRTYVYEGGKHAPCE